MLKVALAQINTACGDVEGNEKKISMFLGSDKAQNADLVIFPELSLVGYPPKDHLTDTDAVTRCEEALARLMKKHHDQSFVVGSVRSRQGQLHNVALWVDEGKIIAEYEKALLPSYDVFYEKRFFSPRKKEFSPVMWKNYKVALTICEDFWFRDGQSGAMYDFDPVTSQLEKGADFLINLSASPFAQGKPTYRRELAAYYARKYQTPFLFCNLIGGNDDLIFDGQSFAMDARGMICAQALAFQEDLLHVDLPMLHAKSMEESSDDLEQKIDAICLGIKDFVRKNKQRKVWVALSGGIDSACVAQLACRALGNLECSLGVYALRIQS
ncbi:MAG: nitrilase-related carbon-nitrogen hydrolase [Bdellovibrionota bacterium]